MVKINQVVDLSAHDVDRVFHALADATRRQMLGKLTQGEASVSELAMPFAMSLAAASKHIKVLVGAELITIEKRGRTRICNLRPGGLRQAAQVIEHYERFWAERLDALDAHLRTKNQDPTDHE